MAQATTEDERERGAAVDAGSGGGRGGGIPLADEGADELPALLAIAVGIAILFIGMIWPTLRDDATHRGGSGEDAAVVQEDPETVEEEPETAEDPETVEEDPALELPDVPAIQGLLDTELAGLNASADGRVVTLSGVVPDAATAEALVAQVAAQPNVDSVDNQLEIAPAAGAAVTATAAQVSIVLEGTVPDEATREAIVARAIEVYSEAQVDDQLVVDDSVGSPVSITLTGSMTDPVLYDQVQAAFADLDGVELSDSSSFALEESSDLEASLNGLEPIQFASGSAIVQPASESILDEAAELLTANPDVALEIGGHTDSLGGDEANQTLSEARAQAVLDALVQRGVTNDLSAVGFGERRLKVSPDEDDPAAQQENRRIEFRII